MTGRSRIFFAAFVGCASCVTTPTVFVANPAKVRSYTFELEKLKHLDAPYVARFENKGKILFFVASDHISGKKFPDLLRHPTLLTIQRLFDDYHPEVAVVEGIHTGEQLSPKAMFKKADECKASAYTTDCGESLFTINAARQSNAQFISGEPDDLEVKSAILREGFSDVDLLAFYVIRQIPQFKRQVSFAPRYLDRLIEDFINRTRERSLSISTPFGIGEFKSWYVVHMSVPKNYSEIEANDSAPDGGPHATFAQRISNKVSLIRDRMVVRRIAAMLNQFSVVAVVYGGSHLIIEEPALADMMGEPTYFNLSSWPKI